MKLMIASDIHGSALYCDKTADAFIREKADKLLLLGDILYHGPRNDLPEGYAPKETIKILSGLSDRILCVRGNCDTEVDQMVLPFPVMADYCVVFDGNMTLYATHGHIYNKNNLPPVCPGDILLYGHTHVPAAEVGENYIYLNPGSVSIPKDGSVRSYMTYSDGLFEWKSLDDGTVYGTFSTTEHKKTGKV